MLFRINEYHVGEEENVHRRDEDEGKSEDGDGEERRDVGEREGRNTQRRPPLGQHVIDIRHHYLQGNTQKQGGLNVSIYPSSKSSDLPFSCS